MTVKHSEPSKVTFALTTLAALKEIDRTLVQVELIPREEVDEILSLIHDKQSQNIKRMRRSA